MEGAFHISVDCYDATWIRHLVLEISIVWYYVELSERGSSEQCLIADAKGDDIED